jgi:hypothetical protein
MRDPTPSGSDEFQKVRIHVFPNDQGSIHHRVPVVFENEPPRHGAMDSEEARWIQDNANRAKRRAVPPYA